MSAQLPDRDADVPAQNPIGANYTQAHGPAQAPGPAADLRSVTTIWREPHGECRYNLRFSAWPKPDMSAPGDLIQSAKRTIQLEVQAVEGLLPRIDEHFVRACELILACSGRVVVVGMG